jgi:hypothetical protein
MHEEMRKYLPIYEETASHIWMTLQTLLLNFLIYAYGMLVQKTAVHIVQNRICEQCTVQVQNLKSSFPIVAIFARYAFFAKAEQNSTKSIQTNSRYSFCFLWLQKITVKGVGRGPTLAWPGWKQSVIAVEVDMGRLETSRFKKCYANCVLLYFPSTEIKSAFNVYWHCGGASGLSCTELSIWEFPFLRGVCWQRWTSIWYSEKGMPQKDTLDNLRTPVCFRIPSSSFTSVSIFSVWCYSSVLYLNDYCIPSPVAGVLDEPWSQLAPLSLHTLKPCPSYVAWRAGMATPLSGFSWVRFVYNSQPSTVVKTSWRV